MSTLFPDIGGMRNSLFLLLLIFLTGCDRKRNYTYTPATQKQGPCECQASKDHIQASFFVNAIGDSVVICKAGKMAMINGGMRLFETWVDFLKHYSHQGSGIIVDCKTGRPFDVKAFDYAIHYKERKLVVQAKIQYTIYDSKTNTWKEGLLRPTYEQIIYAEKGNLKMGEAKIILHPLFYDAKAIELVHELFNNEFKIKDFKRPRYVLITRLLGAALNGDKISGERLLNFENIFGRNSDSQKLLNEYVAVWTDFKASRDLKK